jgi:hypothetical protein
MHPIPTGRRSASSPTSTTPTEHRFDLNLWEQNGRNGWPSAVTAPVDSGALAIDPLSVM